MSQAQEDKQQVFREKLQTEGADGFADGPRPWEQWDESGNQNDNRVWEGSAKRIYPKQSRKRGFGDRLLSGLAVVALGSMLVGIAGVYLSTPSPRQQVVSAIQPAPIVSGRTVKKPAAQTTAAAMTAAPVHAGLDTLPSPAAGLPAAPEQPRTVLDPANVATRTAPVVIPAIDKVAVETVITEAAVTTTVYTQQPSQDEPELVAAIATTAPPLTLASGQPDAPIAADSTETVLIRPTDVSETATEVVAQAEVSEPPFIEWTSATANTPPTVIEQTEQAVPVPAPAAIERAETPVMEPSEVEQPAGPETETAVVALNSAMTDVEAEPEISRELETATQIPVTSTGNWVINLSSYTRKPTAERKLAEFRKKGVDAEVFTTTINEKPMHRIRVTGFRSARSAKAEISTLEQVLDLEGAWVSRR